MSTPKRLRSAPGLCFADELGREIARRSSAQLLPSKPRDGVKILGVGELKTKAAFEVETASKSAAAAIEKAGGSLKTLSKEDVPPAA